MSDIPFHQTRMGQRFFEHTVPELVRQLERLNGLLDRLVDDSTAEHARSAAATRQPTRARDTDPEDTK